MQITATNNVLTLQMKLKKTNKNVGTAGSLCASYKQIRLKPQRNVI
jgi:hypothetical protein